LCYDYYEQTEGGQVMLEVKKCENFEELKQKCQERVAEVPNILFHKEQKLLLEVTITDEFLSQSLYSMLYKSTFLKGQENLGFELTSIGLQPVRKEAIIRELQQLEEKLRNGDL
jgi:hypothetical protein